MEVVVKDFLNVRVGKPSVNAPSYQYLAPGSKLEVDDVLYKGDLFEDNNQWFKDDAGNYYWSGGIEKTLPSVENLFSNKLINYNHLIQNIPNHVLASQGEKIKIAVLDSGIYEEHLDLKDAFQKELPSYNLCRSSHGYIDKKGHGTHVSGLIGARSKSKKGIIGVAPKSILQNIKVLLDSGNAKGEFLEEGFKLVLSQSSPASAIDIVNLSLSVTFSEYKKLQTTLNKVAKNSIIVASAGENDRLLASTFPFYPAYSAEIISIGAINMEFLKSNPNAIFHKTVDYLLPFTDQLSCSIAEKNNYESLKGSSMSTAILSGIIALLLSSAGESGKDNLKFIKQELDKVSIPYTSNLNLNKISLIKPIYQ